MENEFKKCSFAEFLELGADEFSRYESTGKLLKPDPWNAKPVMEWQFIQVKEIQNLMNNGLSYEQFIKIVHDLTDIDIEKIIQKDWISVFKFFKFVESSIKEVNELEKKLAYEPDVIEENSGIEMFNQFGHFVTIDRLAGGDPLKYEQIARMEYSVIFSKLFLNVVDMQFTKNYQTQINRKP